MVLRFAAVCAALLLSFAPAQAFEAPRGVEVVETSKGEALTDDDGMTLYVFRRDEPFESKCYQRCAQNWPPLKARRGDVRVGQFLSIERKDGGFQWTYRGQPLYRWTKDEKEGDITGHGLADVWHIARP